MSTPIPKSDKLEGLELYAPRRARTQLTSAGQVPEPQNLPQVFASDQQYAEDNNRASTTDGEPPKSPETRIEDAIKATVELASSLRGQESAFSRASLQPSANLGLPQKKGLLPPSISPPLYSQFTESGLRGPSSLDPEIVPEPPEDTRRRFVAPGVAMFAVLCAAIVAYCFTIASGFQLNGRQREGGSVSLAAPISHETTSEPGSLAKLVIENQQAFANEPLSLGISVESATGYETLMLAGLAIGTQLSAGVRVSEASWQLSPRDLNRAYVHAPKDFVGRMNAAIELLSPNKKLLESRAVRLDWIPKANASQPNDRVGSETAGAVTILAMAPEAANLMERGRDLLRIGDIASARLLFQRLANAGLAEAALALAATYDPRYLAQHNFIGVAGDTTMAHAWYQRASELGSIEAGRILARTATK
jgi:hypothetical protein